MKSKKKTGILIIILLLAVGIAVVFGGTTKTKKNAEIIIEEGSGSRKIAKLLKEEGVIGSQLAFLVRLQFSEYSGKLQYGKYKFGYHHK